jgi:hypothetical protein
MFRTQMQIASDISSAKRFSVPYQVTYLFIYSFVRLQHIVATASAAVRIKMHILHMKKFKS